MFENDRLLRRKLLRASFYFELGFNPTHCETQPLRNEDIVSVLGYAPANRHSSAIFSVADFGIAMIPLLKVHFC